MTLSGRRFILLDGSELKLIQDLTLHPTEISVNASWIHSKQKLERCYCLRRSSLHIIFGVKYLSKPGQTAQSENDKHYIQAMKFHIENLSSCKFGWDKIFTALQMNPSHVDSMPLSCEVWVFKVISIPTVCACREQTCVFFKFHFLGHCGLRNARQEIFNFKLCPDNITAYVMFTIRVAKASIYASVNMCRYTHHGQFHELQTPGTRKVGCTHPTGMFSRLKNYFLR